MFLAVAAVLAVAEAAVRYPSCRPLPFGHICNSRQDNSEAAKGSMQPQPLKDVVLRVGFIPDKNGYEFDCHGYYDVTGLRSGGSYSEYILSLLREVLGFRIELVSTSTWGARDGTNWTGLVGLARSRLIDLGMCHTTLTEERNEHVDFLLSTMYSTRSFAYEPGRLPLARDVFIHTFTPGLWLCFFASIFLLIVSFRFSTYQHSRWRPDHEPWSWIEVVMWANAAVCQQSYSRHPKGSSCRTMFLIGYLITYLLYTGFAAGVTSLLAVQGLRARLSFRDVLLMKLNLVLQSDSTHLDFLKEFPDSDARALHSHGLLLRNKVNTLSEMFSRLDEKNFVGLGSTVVLSNYLRKKVPNSRLQEYALSRIPRSGHQKAFITPKRSPYSHTFNYWLLRLMESGLLDRGSRRYIRGDQVHRPVRWSSAGLGNVLSAVVIFVGGWFLSVVILFAELAWKRRSSKSEWEIVSRREVLAVAMRKKAARGCRA